MRLQSPIIIAQSQYSTDKPRFSLRLRGPDRIPVEATHFPLQAELHYLEDPSGEHQPVVFSTQRTTLNIDWRWDLRYTLYSSPECKFEDIIRRRKSPPCLRPERLPGGKFKPRNPHFAISAENQFHQIEPGTSATFSLLLELDDWLYELKSGAEFTLGFMGTMKGIPFWRYGTLNVRSTSPDSPPFFRFS